MNRGSGSVLADQTGRLAYKLGLVGSIRIPARLERLALNNDVTGEFVCCCVCGERASAL